ncbi:MAG: rhodanese-like domain-containing protein [Alphaproteobacteria bacterium]|nr:rhodanese-like domain-containing protein [Alphaproteobacteria bacterium]MCB9698148.1 rhodanese-like domain-containing protein [Alphaproteobacteria bacterium]
MNAEEAGQLMPGGWYELDVLHAHRLLDTFDAVIDVREPDEYTGPLGHIEGSRLVPLATVMDQMAGAERHKRYLVLCKSGGRSGRAAAWMKQVGFDHVFNMTGGMLVWHEHRLPLAR